jgi:hypothetical protein
MLDEFACRRRWLHARLKRRLTFFSLATRSFSLGRHGDLYQSNALRRWRLNVVSLNW